MRANFHDPLFKELLVEQLTRTGVTVETQVEISRLPRTIDGIVTVTDPNALVELAAETPFAWFQQYNTVAFKGPSDPLNEHEYHLILGRNYLALGESKISAEQATFTIICGSMPRQQMKRLQRAGTLRKYSAGVYRIREERDPPQIFLVVINELPTDDPRYEMLLPFTSSKERFRQFLRRMFASRRMTILETVLRARLDWIQEFAMIAHGYDEFAPFAEFLTRSILLMSPEKRKDWITQEALPLLSPSELLADLTPEERLTDLSLNEFVRGISAEQRKALLKQLLAEENGEVQADE